MLCCVYCQIAKDTKKIENFAQFMAQRLLASSVFETAKHISQTKTIYD